MPAEPWPRWERTQLTVASDSTRGDMTQCSGAGAVETLSGLLSLLSEMRPKVKGGEAGREGGGLREEEKLENSPPRARL